MDSNSFPPPMDNTIQVFISDTGCGDEYSLRVPDNITVGQLKKMAIGHFLTPAEAVGPSPSTSTSSASNTFSTPSSNTFSTPSSNTFSMASIGSAFSQLRGGGSGSQQWRSVMSQSLGGGSHGAAEVAEPPHIGSRLGDCDPQEYHLLHVGEVRRLSDLSSLAAEKLTNEVHLLLIHRREGSSAARSNIQPHPEYLAMRNMAFSAGLLPDDIRDGDPATSHSIQEYNKARPFFPKPTDRQLDAVPGPERKGKLLLRRVMLGVAHCSLRLLGGPTVTQEAFFAIIDKLERRHKSSMRPMSLRKLKDMGFNEAKGTMALKLKSSVEEAAEYLLTHDPHEYLPPAPPTRQLGPEDDPVEVLMPQFWHFRRLYFLPNSVAYLTLVERGYDRTRAFDALLQTENDLLAADELLAEEQRFGRDLLYTPPPRTHPIMDTILSSLVMQSSLHKPKVLYALLALCENPNNANLWLSDPDTSPVVNFLLKSYHEERYNVGCADPVVL